MKIFEYQRVSTSTQEVAQQHNTVNDFVKSKGWQIDETVSDEGVSGGVSYKDRNLYKLIQRMDAGDTLIVSEISRLGRSMADLNKMVNDELKPRKLRLIIVKMGLDLDCSNLKAIDEMILFAFSFASQIEKELIQDRTKSALDVRKKQLAEKGSFISNAGRETTHLGRPKGCPASEKATKAAAKAKLAAAKSNANNIAFYKYLCLFESKNGVIKTTKAVSELVQELSALGMKTANGMDFNIPRAWATIYKVRKIFAA